MFLFAIAYLSLPVFLMLFTFFSMPFVLLSAIAISVLVFCLYKAKQDGVDSDFTLRDLIKYWPLLLVALVVTFPCIVFPIDVWDWEKHFAVFDLLIRTSWPPVIELSEQTYFLRYWLAWYMMPVLFAKIFGGYLLTFFMYAWTAIGIYVALFLAFRHLHKISHLFVAALVFFLFSGIDAAVMVFYPGYREPLSPHWLQWWTAWGHIGSNLFNIVWIPQHLIGASIGACLFLYNRRLSLQYSVLIAAIVFLWSPFCALGLLPLGIWALAKEGYKTSLTIQNLFAAPLLLVPLMLYGMQGSQSVPFMLAWEFHTFTFSSFVIFCVIEFLLVLGILYYAMPKQRFLIASLGMFLTLLSLIVRDVTFNNLLMRGSMPAVCIMAALVVKFLLENKGWRRDVLVLYLLIGAFPIVAAFAKGFTPSMRGIDKKITFDKLTSIYTYEEHPYITDFYLVKTDNVQKFFDVSLMRGLTARSEIGR